MYLFHYKVPLLEKLAVRQNGGAQKGGRMSLLISDIGIAIWFRFTSSGLVSFAE